MSTTLAQDLESSLTSYSVCVDYWEPNAGDTFTFLGHRQFLEKHLEALSADQKRRLYEADRIVLAFAAQNYDIETDDVVELRMVADCINGAAI